ncbi:MAG TPA: acyl-CoA dehydrogenase family protein [Mycobacteriales bacterium]
MDFAFSDEQDMLRAAARSWLADRYPVDRVVELADSDAGWDPAVWSELTGLGWLDPELGLLEQAVLAEEAGYALLPAPWFSSVALAQPVLGAPPTRPATLAWVDDAAATLRDAASSVACRADDDVDGWRLSGTKRAVPDGAAAAEAIVVARTADEVALFRVDLAEHADVVRPLSTEDRTRRLAELRLDGTPAEPVEHAAAGTALTAVRRRSAALLACEAVGVTQRALELAVDHAKTRTQFDRPIGSYQGVSHGLADVYAALQLARSLAYRAAWCVSADDPAADEATATATVAAAHAAVGGCETAIQSMGGIGFTWDHPLHRFYKRAQWIAAFDGTSARRRADLAALIFS